MKGAGRKGNMREIKKLTINLNSGNRAFNGMNFKSQYFNRKNI